MAHHSGRIHVSMNMGVAKTAFEPGLADPIFGIDIATGMALLGGVRRLPEFDHDAMGGFQTIECQVEVALAKAGEQPVKASGEVG